MKSDSTSVDTLKTYEIPVIVDFQDGLNTKSETAPEFYDRSITDVLRGFPVVYFSSGPDQMNFITNKGRKPSYTGIYVNGHALPDMLTGHFNLTLLPLHFFEKVEGGRTVSGAELSSVNLISRLNRYEEPYSYVDFMIGSYGSSRYVLDLTRALTNDLGFYLSGSYYTSDGYRDNGDAERSSIYSNIYYNHFFPVRFDLFYVGSDYGVPGSTVTPVNGRQEDSWLDVSGTVGIGRTAVTLFYDYENIYYDDTVHGKSLAIRSDHFGALIARFDTVLDVTLDYGLSGFLSAFDGGASFPTSLNRFDLWTRIQQDLGLFFWQAGGYFESASDHDYFFCPHIEAGIDLWQFASLNAALSRDARAPSLFENWAPFDTLNPYLRIAGNPTLVPEYCWVKEIGLRGSNFLLNFYRLDYINYITVNTDSTDYYIYESLANFQTSGLEGFLNYPVRLYNADSSVMTKFTIGLNGNAFFDGDSIPYVPEYNAGAILSVERATERLSLGLAVSGELWGTRHDVLGEEFDGFSVLSVAGMIKFITLSFIARIDNVLDTAYERIPYYPMPMRNLDVAIKWEFWD
jgi:outer membrane cobalamin receptor